MKTGVVLHCIGSGGEVAGDDGWMYPFDPADCVLDPESPTVALKRGDRVEFDRVESVWGVRASRVRLVVDDADDAEPAE